MAEGKINASIRLAKVLQKLVNTQGATLAVVATSAFGYQGPDTNRTTLKAQSTMHRLLESAIREVEAYLPHELDFYLPEFTHIAAAVGPVAWIQSWDQAKSNLRSELVKHVFHTGQRLKTIIGEVELDGDELAQILDEIDLLTEAIEAVAIDPLSRERLMERIQSLRNAVDEYSLWGIDRIQRDFDATVGCALPLVVKDENGEVKAHWKHVLVKLAALSTIIGSFNSAYKNVHDFAHLLQAGAQAVIADTRASLPRHSTTSK